MANSASDNRDNVKTFWSRRWATAPFDPPYGLITAGASLHWMDARVVMPRFAASLAPGATLAVLEIDDDSPPWRERSVEIIKRYEEQRTSRLTGEPIPAHHDDLSGLIAEIEGAGLFLRRGEHRTSPVVLRRTVDEYLEFLHSTSTLARCMCGHSGSSASTISALPEIR